jgi:hypothetical protein
VHEQATIRDMFTGHTSQVLVVREENDLSAVGEIGQNP